MGLLIFGKMWRSSNKTTILLWGVYKLKHKVPGPCDYTGRKESGEIVDKDFFF